MAWGVKNTAGIKWVDHKDNNQPEEPEENLSDKLISNKLFKQISLTEYSPDPSIINEILNS